MEESKGPIEKRKKQVVSSNDIKKSRNLSPMEYLEALEIEWWVCNLRRKIYPSPNDKDYYNRTANKKRDRIKEICDRNEIESIFSDKNKMKELNKKFMKQGGMPIFEGMEMQDVLNYYLPNNDVRCFYGFMWNKPVTKIGKILSFDYPTSIVTVKLEDGTIEDLSITKVSRIM